VSTGRVLWLIWCLAWAGFWFFWGFATLGVGFLLAGASVGCFWIPVGKPRPGVGDPPDMPTFLHSNGKTSLPPPPPPGEMGHWSSVYHKDWPYPR
jgi:hypothetical protein